MKAKNSTLLSALAISLGAAFIVPVAGAADGLVEFEGSITTQSCTINGGTPDLKVTLPKVSSASLVRPGSWAGRTPFSIALTDCGAPLNGAVKVYFEPGAEVDVATGNLNITNGAGNATNVQVALLSSAFSPIKLGDVVANTPSTNLVNGAAKFDYYAQYQSLGAATAGGVTTRVNYTIIYP
ncbi:type 1 fimbrial protein [Pseudomonas edaphica]|uniref:Type 1 fimbrial protein n=2 Tax=Pseudomonas edaphica TaxID=2006980 RepID=A0ABY2U3H1_9PSED|nr:type 1 fimbrial protein [Pseudomonas edaphica]